MINKTVYILNNTIETEESTEEDLLNELTGWGFEDVNEAKRVANFGAVVAPHNRVFKVITYVEEVVK